MSKASQNYARLHTKSITIGCKVREGNTYGEVIDLTSFGYAEVRFKPQGICAMRPIANLHKISEEQYEQV